MSTLPLVRLALLVLAALAPAGSADDPPTFSRGQELFAQGDWAGAARVLAAVCEREPANANAWYLYGYALHAQGLMEEALEVHVKAAGFPQTAGIGAYNAACACALLERDDDAFAWLAKARAAGFPGIESARTDPDLERLRADKRFAAMFPTVLEGAELFAERPRVLYTLVGEAAGDQFGWVARPVGDLDGDGAADFAATSPSCSAAGPGAGRVYVHSGRTGKLLFSADGAPGQALGTSVAPAGDVNGDGVPDVVAGAPPAGRAVVLSGVDGAVLLELRSDEPGDAFGVKVCGLGDLDGDGRADVAVGAWRSDAAGADAGRVHVFSGRTGERLFALDGDAPGDLLGSSVASTADREHRLLVVGASGAGGKGRALVYRASATGAERLFAIEPDETSANLGQYFVSVLGDVDGDGTPDVYASDWNNAARGQATGRVYVHSGATGERLLTLTGSRAGEGFGTSPSVAGDVDGDGRADLIVGAWQNADGAPSGGRCYLYSGTGALLATYTCRQAGDTFGFDAMGLGDVDGDGGVDFLLTSGWSPAKGPRTGRVFVIAGPVPER